MQIHRLIRSQLLPISLEKAWEYFSRPENLNNLTPNDMHFEILTDVKGKKMHQGMIIEYRVSPLFRIPLRWVTEITEVEEPYFFIDTQLKGPFALWHHEHHFEKKGNGTQMTDKLHYALPLGFLGEFANKLIVEKRVLNIFNYREEKVKSLFQEEKSDLVRI